MAPTGDKREDLAAALLLSLAFPCPPSHPSAMLPTSLVLPNRVHCQTLNSKASRPKPMTAANNFSFCGLLFAMNCTIQRCVGIELYNNALFHLNVPLHTQQNTYAKMRCKQVSKNAARSGGKNGGRGRNARRIRTNKCAKTRWKQVEKMAIGSVLGSERCPRHLQLSSAMPRSHECKVHGYLEGAVTVLL